MDSKVIGERLKSLRGDQSREVVANAVDISCSALAMYEQGERIPRDTVKIRLAKYFKKSVQSIFFAD